MPASLRYVTGDATAPQGEGPKVIVHVCNDIGGWGRGFVLALSKRWAAPEARFRRWHRDGRDGDVPYALGSVQFVEVEPGLWVANLIGQHDVLPAADGAPPVRYDAIRDGLIEVARFAARNGASVHMPRMGAGLAGGDWDTIAAIVQAKLADDGVAVTVYDLPAR